MWPDRVEAHDDLMFTNYETAKAMVTDHQQQLQDEAGRRRLIRFARRIRRAAGTEHQDVNAVVHHLPTRARVPVPPEERAAS
jgi:hypothetical protein